MESQPQNPEFSINPENFHPSVCQLVRFWYLHLAIGGRGGAGVWTHRASKAIFLA